MLQNPEINAVFSIGNVDTNSAISGVLQAGKKGKVGVCGMNIDESALNNIKSGSQLCGIEQGPYMLGYLSVAILNAYVNYGVSVTTRDIETGPIVVDASNVDAADQRRESGRPLSQALRSDRSRTARRLPRAVREAEAISPLPPISSGNATSEKTDGHSHAI